MPVARSAASARVMLALLMGGFLLAASCQTRHAPASKECRAAFAAVSPMVIWALKYSSSNST